MKKLIALLFLLVTFSIPFAHPNPVLASHKSFQDNFNNELESASKWTVSGPQLFNGDGSKADWIFKDNAYGMKINNKGFQFNEAIPKDWDNVIKNYTFEGDIKLVNGVDTNIVFRYQDHTHWYGIHGINSENKLVLQKAGGSWSTSPSDKTYHFDLNTFYHFKIIISGENIKVYINGQLLWDVTDVGTSLSYGSPGLQASTGAVTSVEVYFDKISVTHLDSSLDVPMFKQTAEPWQGNEYNTASSWSAPEPSTINRWGCAMTSASMVLKYHGYNKIDATTNLDPGTLNAWLKNQEDGYVEEGFINWLAISRLSKLAKTINNITTFDALEYRRGPPDDKTQLTNDLDAGKPDILEVPGHFIVAKGVNGTTFDINDPFYDRATLNDGYSNTFLSMGRYIPSNTNLSYLMLTINADVDVIASASGKRAGSNGTTTFTEIPQSSYYTQSGIKDPVSGKTTKSFKTLLIPTPADDTYSLSIATTSAIAKQFSLKTYRYTTTGSATINQITGYSRSDEPATFSFEYKQNPSSTPPAPTDTTPPQIVSTKTLDNNKNGKIDAIEVTFARDLNGSTVNPTGTDFTVQGYTITKAKEVSPGVVQIAVSEKSTNDTGTTPTVTLKGDGASFGVQNLPSVNNVWNNQQTATPSDGIPPTIPVADIPGDKYTTPQKVTLASSDAPNIPTIYYTLDESDPATSSAKKTYTAPVEINGSSVTLKAIAQDAAGNVSDTLTEVYEIAPKIDDTSITIASSSTTSFTITWTTDRASHSRLVFGTKSKKIKGSGTNYGYDKSTLEATLKKTSHSVTITGLTPGATYYYRLISRGSPEQVTEERSITLPNDPTPTPTPTPSTSSSSSSNTSSSSSSTAQPASCNDEKPKSAPTLISAFAGINTVALTWKEAEDPVSYYLIAYGTEPGKLQYGNPNIGGKGTTSFVVENLSGWQTYYFKVRAGNGCTPGDFSNEIPATPIGFGEQGLATGFKENVLGTKTSKEDVKGASDVPTSTPTIQPITNRTKPHFFFLATLLATIATIGVIALKLWKK